MIGVGNSISKWTIKSIKDNARKDLEGISDEYRTNFVKLILLTFEQWKYDHGDRNPPAGHGLLNTGVIPFDSAHPWQCAGLGVSNPIDLAFKLWLEKYPPFSKIVDIVPIERVFAFLIVLANSRTEGDAIVRAHNLIEQIKHGEIEAALKAIIPDAITGIKFRPGRKPGSGGPIRKAIAKHLSKNNQLKNPELWEAIKNKPPRGWTAYESPKLGKYLEGPGLKNMNYERFCNVCGEERKRTRQKITG